MNIPEAMWSDGTTMWVSDYEDAKDLRIQDVR